MNIDMVAERSKALQSELSAAKLHVARVEGAVLENQYWMSKAEGLDELAKVEKKVKKGKANGKS